MDGAGFAFRGDHRITSIRMQANMDYSMSSWGRPFRVSAHNFGGLILYPGGI
jgi:hypothetical protein